jgi:propionyl-CoA synthetase
MIYLGIKNLQKYLIHQNLHLINGILNISYNCLDVHCNEGRGEEIAIIFDSAVTNTIKKYTYNQLLVQVKKLSIVLSSEGVRKGDRVVIYMSNIPENLIAMLSCARIGAIHVVVYGGLNSKELASRFIECKPKLISSASCGINGSKTIDYKSLLDEAIKIANHSFSIKKTIILQREPLKANLYNDMEMDWSIAVAKVGKSLSNSSVFIVPPEPLLMKSTEPLYIMYTYGTNVIAIYL